MAGRRAHSMKARVDEALDAVAPAIPTPFDLRLFLDRVAEQLGRRIELIGDDPESSSLPCGLLVCTADVDYIHTAVADVDSHHGRHIAIHELGHRMLGHVDIDRSEAHERENALRALRPLVPNLPDELILRMLRRTAMYTDRAEREAELFADRLLAQRTWRHSSTAVPQARQGDDAFARWCSTFGARASA